MKIPKRMMRTWFCESVPDNVDDYGNTRWHKAKQAARLRGKEFHVSREFYDALMARPCDYCGLTISADGIGLDRIDNALDYFEENVIPCCGLCNLARNWSITPNEMYKFIGPAIKALRLHRENNKSATDKSSVHDPGID